MKKTQQADTKMAQKYVNILGIKLISTSKDRVLASINKILSYSQNFDNLASKFYIVTPNPELILMAQKNSELKASLNSARFSVPDGVGLKLAQKNLNIVKGREFFDDLMHLANKKSLRVFLLGGKMDEAKKASEALRMSYRKIKFETFDGPVFNDKALPQTKEDKEKEVLAIDRINKFMPHLLFVAFGNPKQEIWIHRNIKKLRIIGAMAVGGTFRYVSGMSKLPPGWMEKAGLEWLFRLITEPYRIGRIFKAVVVFPLTLLLAKKRDR